MRIPHSSQFEKLKPKAKYTEMNEREKTYLQCLRPVLRRNY